MYLLIRKEPVYCDENQMAGNSVTTDAIVAIKIFKTKQAAMTFKDAHVRRREYWELVESEND